MKAKVSELSKEAINYLVAKLEGEPTLEELSDRLDEMGLDELREECSSWGIEWEGYLSPEDLRRLILAERKGLDYASNHAYGGPIIEREKIGWINNGRTDTAGKPYRWLATKNFSDPLSNYYGPTHLVASLRCYIASEMGEEVEVPDELATGGGT